MPIPLKSPRDIDQMRRAGSLVRRILDEAAAAAVPGVSTRELDALISARIRDAGAQPASLQTGFPAASSITLNEEAAHAPPGDRLIRPGDVVSIDAALRLGDWCADAAVVVGESRGIAAAARGALAAALHELEPGRPWSAAAQAAAAAAARHGCTIVGEYGGHGIGRSLHEPPGAVFVPPGKPFPSEHDFVLRPGMVLTIEPIVVQGGGRLVTMGDGWTVLTADRSWAAHEERTIAVTRNGAADMTAP